MYQAVNVSGDHLTGIWAVINTKTNKEAIRFNGKGAKWASVGAVAWYNKNGEK